jgi:hypothetical protein
MKSPVIGRTDRSVALTRDGAFLFVIEELITACTQ